MAASLDYSQDYSTLNLDLHRSSERGRRNGNELDNLAQSGKHIRSNSYKASLSTEMTPTQALEESLETGLDLINALRVQRRNTYESGKGSRRESDPFFGKHPRRGYIPPGPPGAPFNTSTNANSIESWNSSRRIEYPQLQSLVTNHKAGIIAPAKSHRHRRPKAVYLTGGVEAIDVGADSDVSTRAVKDVIISDTAESLSPPTAPKSIAEGWIDTNASTRASTAVIRRFSPDSDAYLPYSRSPPTTIITNETNTAINRSRSTNRDGNTIHKRTAVRRDDPTDVSIITPFPANIDYNKSLPEIRDINSVGIKNTGYYGLPPQSTDMHQEKQQKERKVDDVVPVVNAASAPFKVRNSPGERCLGCEDDTTPEELFCCRHCAAQCLKKSPLVRLPQEHTVYQEIAQRFKKEWRHPTKKPDVVYIYAIISSDEIHKQYQAYQTLIESKRNCVLDGQKPGNEQLRYHGTHRNCFLGDKNQLKLCKKPNCSLCNIIRSSFDINKFGRRWGRFGKGIYTSATSSKAHDYTTNRKKIAFRPNSNLKALLLNNVIIGKGMSLRKNADHLQAPPDGYDSVLGVPGKDLNYDETSVYTNNAIRPAFLIMYA